MYMLTKKLEMQLGQHREELYEATTIGRGTESDHRSIIISMGVEGGARKCRTGRPGKHGEGVGCPVSGPGRTEEGIWRTNTIQHEMIHDTRD